MPSPSDREFRTEVVAKLDHPEPVRNPAEIFSNSETILHRVLWARKPRGPRYCLYGLYPAVALGPFWTGCYTLGAKEVGGRGS